MIIEFIKKLFNKIKFRVIKLIKEINNMGYVDEVLAAVEKGTLIIIR